MHKKPYVLLELPLDLMKRMHLLDSIDTTVGHRHEKGSVERKDQAEIYTIVNAIKLGQGLPIALPARVIHSDRPDIVINSATTRIGIEIVEAVSETTAAMDCEKFRLADSPKVYWPVKQVPGEKKKTAEEIRKLIFSDDPGDGSVGNGAVRWAKAIAHFVGRKIETVFKPGFQRFEQNWLLVYDNWREPASDLKEATATLQNLLNDMRAFRAFDLILVLDDKRLYIFEAKQI